MFFKFSTVYILPILLILSWWYWAFSIETGRPVSSQHSVETTPHFSENRLIDLPPLERKQIQSALAGNIEMMTRLIATWDIDAQILASRGIDNILRLPEADFVKSQVIGRQLNPSGLPHGKKHVYDDLGILFSSDRSYQKLLPQTFVSASFLLALTTPEHIIAIPHGLREQISLYPEELTLKIPLNTDRHHAEELFQAGPDIAFVADYSHPCLLETLSNQGVPLFTLKSINTLPEICDAIIRIGTLIDQPAKAELLALFMDAALMAIDNRLMAFHDAKKPKVMVLNYYTQFSAPTKKTISGQLLQRLQTHYTFFPSPAEDSEEWSLPVDQEQIVQFDPDCLIISASDPEALLHIHKNPAFDQLYAKKAGRICFVDGNTQAPTQYIILAYFDLARALMP